MSRLFLLLIFCSSIQSSFSQVDYFNNTYDLHLDEEYPVSLIEVDSGYLIASKTGHYDSYNVHFLFLDNQGVYIGWNSWGVQNENYELGHVIKWDDKSYMAGLSHSHQGYDHSFVLALLDAKGDSIWVKKYKSPLDYVYTIQLHVSDQKEVFLLGTDIQYGFSGSFPRVKLIKTDSIGAVLWEKDYGDNNPWREEVCNMAPLADGGFMICGLRDSMAVNEFFLLKIDSAGNQKWLKTFDSIGGGNIVTMKDGNLLYAGGITKQQQYYGYIMKIDTGGNIIWDQQIPSLSQTDIFFQKVIAADDGSFVLIGTYWDNMDKWSQIMKVDSMGNDIWKRSYRPDPTSSFTVNNIIETSDAGYLLSVYTYKQLEPKETWLLKIDSMRLFYDQHSGIESGVREKPVIYPNPTTGRLNISWANPSGENVAFSIYNLHGQKVFYKNFSPIAKRVEETFDLTHFKSGVYLLELRSEDYRTVEKIVFGDF